MKRVSRLLQKMRGVPSEIMCVRCANFLHARLFHARVPLANSYLVRMSNRSRYQDEAFEALIIESETWRERRKEGSRRKRMKEKTQASWRNA